MLFRFAFVLCVVSHFFLSSCAHAEKKQGLCDGRQWKDPREQMECKYPNPPIGRWSAVYSHTFAEMYGLPKSNISTDLSPGIDYMEMDVVSYSENGTACLVNMLIKKPHDIAVFNSAGKEWVWGEALHESRDLLHMLDINDQKHKLRRITTFGFGGRYNPYHPKRGYSMGSRFGFYAPDVLDGYDYVSANSSCYHILKYQKGFPDKWALDYAKATVWGGHTRRFSLSHDDPMRPRGRAFYDSIARINIPKEIVLQIFKDMPLGGHQ